MSHPYHTSNYRCVAFLFIAVFLLVTTISKSQSLNVIVDPNCSNWVTYELYDPTGLIASQPLWEVISGSDVPNVTDGLITSVNWHSSGTIRASFSIHGGNGQQPDSRQVDFVYVPQPSGGGTISGPTSVCFGASGILSVTGVSGTPQWQSCESGCSNTDDQGWTTMLSGAFSGLTTTTSFRVKGNPNCGNPYSPIHTVTVNPIPTPTINADYTVVDVGAQHTYTTQPSKTNYVWNLTGGTIVSGQGTSSVTIQWNQGGDQTIQVAYEETGCSPSSPGEFSVRVRVNNYNWIKETVVLVEGQTNIAAVDGLQISSKQKNINWTYFDGLGRPMQSISVQGSPLKKDLVQPVAYDKFGRESKKYLPYVNGETDGYYKPKAIRVPIEGENDDEAEYLASPQYSFYQQAGGLIASDTKPFSSTNFEASPLNRVSEQGSPGAAWLPDNSDSYTSPVDRSIKMAYELNTVEDEVLMWRYEYPNLAQDEVFGIIDAPSSNPPALNYYPANSLYKNKTKDENRNEVIEYIDKEGRTILKRVQAVAGTPAINNTNYASTYYIYDDFGSLVTVLPPEATKNLDGYFSASAADQEEFLKRWAFRYSYDERRRMIFKQVPGADPVYMIYDDRDRLVFTQDGVQRTAAKWSFTKYDVLNRPIITGIYTHGEPSTQRQMSALISTTNMYEAYNGEPAYHGYTNTVFDPEDFEENNFEVLTVTYYDNYNFRNDLIGGQDYNYKVNDIPCPPNDNFCQEPAAFTGVVGQVTGVKVNVLNTTDYLWSVSYYDDKYRPIQVITKNAFGGIDQTTSVFDFAGKVLKTKTTTRKPAVVGTPTYPDIMVHRRFNYDHVGRLEQTYHRIDQGTATGKEVLLSEQGYNELGQLITKKLHRSALEVTADPAVGQPGVVYGTDLVLSQYDPAVTAYIASNSITIGAGFSVPSGGSFTARLGYSQTDADAINNAQTYAQEIDYRYNIRGWLTRINDSELSNVDGGTKDYFGMELAYNESIGVTANPEFNGNISAITWSTNLGLGAGDALEIPEPTARAYAFTYDPMNRLKTSDHFEKTAGWNASTSFHEDINEYDLNGNIKSLSRTGKGGNDMDILSYETYIGNQLMKVTDTGNEGEGFKDGNTSGDDYLYDDNGNMAVDKNKDIATIEYNHLNLPSKVVKENGDYLKYVYNAAGVKMSQIVYNASDVQQKKTDYLGEFFFENDTLRFINHEEGRVIVNENDKEYQYTLKDHLGNVRITFTTKEETDNLVATMDDGKQDEEEERFGGYNSITNQALDPTPAEDAGDKILVLNGSTLQGGNNGQVGLTRSLSVVPGDVVTASVNAKYEQGSGDGTLAVFATALTEAFLLTPNPEPSEFITPFEALSLFGAAIVSGDESILSVNDREVDDELPQGFLNILVYDKEHNLVDVAFKQVGSQTSTLTASVNIRQAGYVYVFLSNDGVSQRQIGFDNYSVTYEHSAVIQQDDYYPFGLTFNSYSRQNSTPNQYKFNGKEEQDELDIGWLDYGARMYDASTSRWLVLDPLANKYYQISPYTYVANNPVKFIDPDGKRIVLSGTATFQKAALASLQKLSNDKLAMRKDGTVIIVSLGTENKGKNFAYGTALVRSLNGKEKKDHTHTIVETTGGNQTTSLDPTGASTKGKGSDTKIEFNPTKTTGGIDVAGGTTRPAEIGLGHEAIHAGHANSGTRDTTMETTKTDPDSKLKGVLTKEETQTRKEENIIRKEQGVTERQLPK